MFARALIILAVLAVSTAWSDPIAEDATIPAPQILSVQPYEDDEKLNGMTGNFLLIRFSLVPDAVSYRIWREVWVIRDLATLLETLKEPASEFVPWAMVKADATANAEKGTIIISPFGPVLTDWAISAIVERNGVLYRSPLRYFDLPTAVEAKSWGQIKHRTIDP